MAADSENPGIVKNIFTGYFILILHVVLLVLLGLFIIFFRGLIQYMPWILGGGLVLLLLGAVWLYMKFKRQRDSVQRMRSSGQAVEISLLGGMASMRIGGATQPQWGAEVPLQLEDPQTSRMRSLERLMDMYNHELISKEEFLRLKQDVLEGSSTSGDDSDAAEEATIVEGNQQ